MTLIDMWRSAQARTARLDCDQARPLLSLCLDDEANELERMAAARHVRRCPECRRFLEEAQAAQRQTRGGLSVERYPDQEARVAGMVVSAIRTPAPEVVPGAPLHRRVAALRRLVSSHAARNVLPAGGRRGVLAPAFGAALALVLVAVTLTGGSGSPSLSRQQLTLALPQVLSSDTLDPSYRPYLDQDLGGGRIVVAAGSADEKLLFFESPMSFHEEFHYRPEDL